jgi:hypothetical protein
MSNLHHLLQHKTLLQGLLQLWLAWWAAAVHKLTTAQDETKPSNTPNILVQEMLHTRNPTGASTRPE